MIISDNFGLSLRIISVAKFLQNITGIGIGLGIAWSLKLDGLKMICASVAGGIASYFSKIKIWELLLLALSVSMDAFAVSICKGLAMKKATLKAGLTCGIWFGGFQALMPLIGFFLGTLFAEAIKAFDHWVAFGLLAIIGGNMLKEAFGKEEPEETSGDLGVKTMFVMAVATSIDALAVGISLAMAGNVNIYLAVVLIGVFTGTLSAIGVKIGNIFGDRFEKKAQMAGGVILVLLGIKILVEHLVVG